MKHLLIVTTTADLSASFFEEAGRKAGIKVSIAHYSDSSGSLPGQSKTSPVDAVYFRDPFNMSIPSDKIEKTLEEVKRRYPNAYSIDHISSYKDLLIEDKLTQYERLTTLMPITSNLSRLKDVEFSRQIVKKRISCRSRDIHFTSETLPKSWETDGYIAQEKLDIDKEWRVFVVFGSVVDTVAVKSSKTTSQKVKMTKSEPVTEAIADLALLASTRMKIDVAGIDIARDRRGRLYVLEVNRSPQFSAFRRETQINLAERIVDRLGPDMPQINQKDLKVLGRLERVWFPEFGTPDEGVVAKIDTGADNGALHCTGERLVHGKDGQITLEFQPFDDRHNVIRTKNYELTKVRNVHGIRERYRIKTTVRLRDGKDYPIELTLVDRKHMKYEVIIGWRFLDDKFVVDVSRENI